MRRKAISGIIAGVIFFSMLFTAGMGLILFTLTSFHSYDQAQAEALANSQAKTAESLALRTCDTGQNALPDIQPFKATVPPSDPCNTASGSVGNGIIGLWVQNTGSATVMVQGIWMVDAISTSLVIEPTTFSSPYTLAPGQGLVLNTGYNASKSTHNFEATVISSRGSQFSAAYPPPPLPNVGPELTTTLSANPIPPGGSVYDTASLSGVESNSSGIGLIKFYYSTVNSCPSASALPLGNSSGYKIYGAGNVKSGSAPPPSFVIGVYYIYATYTDTQGHTITSPCEPLTVSNIGPSIYTTLSQSVIPQGGQVYDTAALSGFSGATGYSVHYYYFGNPGTGIQDGTCSTTPTSAGSVTVTGTTVPRSPSTIQYPNRGTYSWYATLINPSGGVIATSPCEQLNVGLQQISLTTTLSPPQVNTFPVVVTDTATVFGISNAANYYVRYFYFTDGACQTPSGGNFISPNKTIASGTVAPPSSAVTLNTKGNYSFMATLYDPSHSFVASSSCEPLPYSAAPIGILTTLSPPVLAQFPQVVFDTASVTGVSSAAGYQVRYYYFGVNGTSSGACGTSPHAAGRSNITAGTVAPPSTGITYTVAGTYSWHALLYDRLGNLVATSPCEQLVTLTSVPSSFGLGFLSLDFNSYKAIYTTGNCQPVASPCTALALHGGFVASAPLAYTLTSPQVNSQFVFFSVNITNTDPSGRNIVLDAQSVLNFIQVPASGSGGGTASATPWFLGSVGANGAIATSFPGGGILIPNENTAPKGVTIFFAVTPGSTFSKYPSPSVGGSWPIVEGVFMYLHGVMGKGCTTLSCAGATPIGQNEPLVVTEFTNAVMTLGISTGPLGTLVTPVTGSGFSANSPLTFHYDGNVLTTTPSSVTSSGTGTFSGVSFQVPTSAGGIHVVSVQDSSGIIALAFFNVSPAPTLTINPTSGTHGTNTLVTLSGTNYAVGKTYGFCLSLNSSTVNCVGATGQFTATASGSIPTSITLTANQPTGKYYVIVYSLTTSVVAVSAVFTET